MKRVELLASLGRAIRKRNPLLADHLRSGLSASVISRRLKKVSGKVEPLFDLYEWHDGTEPLRTVSGVTHNISLNELAFFPEEIFYFIDLEMAVAALEMWAEAAEHRPELKEGVRRYFPLFWDGNTAYLALDIDSRSNSRVIFFDNESDEPFRQAYATLDEFLIDALRANETGEPLRFFEEGLKG